MKPAFISKDPCFVNGQPSQRLLIVFESNNCEYREKTGGGCTMCGLYPAFARKMTFEDYKSQFDSALTKENLENVSEIQLETLGSFLNDNEFPPEFQDYAFKACAKFPEIQKIFTESRAEYLTAEKLSHVKTLVGNKTLEIAIGLESSNDYIRNNVLNKRLEKKDIEELAKRMGNIGINLATYIFIKPPTLNENESIEDAIESTKYVFDLAKRHKIKTKILFQPAYIALNTQLEKMYLKNEYSLPNIWSVVEIIKKTASLGEIFIALSDEARSDNRHIHGCKQCHTKIVEAIQTFNQTQDIASINSLESIDCQCKKDFEKKVRHRAEMIAK